MSTCKLIPLIIVFYLFHKIEDFIHITQKGKVLKLKDLKECLH